MNLENLTINEAAKLLEEKKISSVELTKSYLERINKVDPLLHAFLTVTNKSALKEAEESDKRRLTGNSRGPLDGIPGSYKDIIATKGVNTTGGSKILENFVPPYDAFVVSELKKAGSVMIGKTNPDEFAMGSSTEYSAYGPTKNPWNLDRVPGGSSGGSAVAVASDLSTFSLGTDTGGSIRQPAGWTGTVGFKPTYGRVSRNGIFAMASSLDQVGTFTRSVKDASLLLSIIGTPDKLDSTHIGTDVPQFSDKTDIRKLKIGVVKEFFEEGIEKPVFDAVHRAIDDLRKSGADIKEVSLPMMKFALAAYYILCSAEVSTNLERYDGIKYGYSAANDKNANSLLDVYSISRDVGFGPEPKRRTMLGGFVLSAGYYEAYYTKGQKVRALIQKQFKESFKDVDVLVGPSSPTMPFKFGEGTSDPLKMYMADILTVPVNVAGLPGMTIPCGLSEGLPIGLQIIADQFREDNLFAVASAYEASTDWHLKYPDLR